MRKRLIAILLCLTMVLTAAVPGFAAEGDTSLLSGSYNYLRTGTLSESVSTNYAGPRKVSDSWYFNEDWFYETEEETQYFQYNESLATLSMQLAQSTGGPKRDWAEYTKAFLSAMGFKDIEAYPKNANDMDPVKAEAQRVVVAHRTLKAGTDDESELFVIVPAGCEYKAGWINNLDIGSGESTGEDVGLDDYSHLHQGFYESAKAIRENIDSYSQSINDDYASVKVWLAGYSRGAAVSDILGAMLVHEALDALYTDSEELSEDERKEQLEAIIELVDDSLYVYNFATPYVGEFVYEDENRLLEPDDYPIHNIVNSGDLVTYLPPIAMSSEPNEESLFYLYGHFHYLFGYEGLAEAENEMLKLLEKLDADFAKEYKQNGKQSDFKEMKLKSEIDMGELGSLSINKLLTDVASAIADPEFWEDAQTGEQILDYLIDGLFEALINSVHENAATIDREIKNHDEGASMDLYGSIEEVKDSELTQMEFVEGRIHNGLLGGINAWKKRSGDEADKSSREIYNEVYYPLARDLADYFINGFDLSAASANLDKVFETDKYYDHETYGQSFTVTGLADYFDALRESENDELADTAKGYIKNILSAAVLMYLYTVVDQKYDGVGDSVETSFSTIDRALALEDIISENGISIEQFEASVLYILHFFDIFLMLGVEDAEYTTKEEGKAYLEGAFEWDDISPILEKVIPTKDENAENSESVEEVEITEEEIALLDAYFNTAKSIYLDNRAAWLENAKAQSALSSKLLDAAVKNMKEFLVGNLGLIGITSDGEYAELYRNLTEGDYAYYIANLFAYSVFGLDSWTVTSNRWQDIMEAGGAVDENSAEKSSLWDLALNNLATLYHNIKRIVYAHYPEVYLSALKSQDELYNAKSNGGGSSGGSSGKSSGSSSSGTVNQVVVVGGETATAEENTETTAETEENTAEATEEAKKEAYRKAALETFTDIPDYEWYVETVGEVLEKGLMNGTGKKFRPNDKTTREQAIAVLHRLSAALEIEGEGGSATDVNISNDTSDWAVEDLRWAIENGVSDGKKPLDEISREQFVTMLFRMMVPEDEREIGAMGLAGYSDAGEISDWAYNAMQWAVIKGLITGYKNGTIAPTKSITRAELATLLVRASELA